MSNTKQPKTGTKTGTKEKIFHPLSRKAGQITRIQLRKNKLSEAASKRSRKHHSETNFYGFCYHAMPDNGETLTLDGIHDLIRDIWLPRHDGELETERAARRKGRPKSTKEHQLEEIKLREAEEYRTGMEVPDLTHKPTVELFRSWDQKEFAFVQLLRFIRISSSKPNVALISRLGKHPLLLENQNSQPIMQDEEMEPVIDDVDVILTEPPSRFASSMMTMDEPF